MISDFFAKILKLLGMRDRTNSASTHRVQSFTDPSEFYHINSEGATCSCPDWTKRRSHFKALDPRRLCKHLTKFYNSTKDPRFSVFSGIISKYSDLGWGIPLTKSISIISNEHDSIAVLEPSKDEERPWYGISHRGFWYSYSKTLDKWEGNHSLPQPALDVFFGHIFGVSKIETNINTIRRSTDKEDIPKSLLGSWGVSENIFNNGGWVAFGVMEGVSVRAFINPRSSWQCFLIERDAIPYDVKNDDWRGPNKLSHIMPVAKTWLVSEYQECRIKKKAKKQRESS